MLTSYIGKSHWVYVIVIFLFSIWGTKSLFHPGLFTAHDIWHQVVRFYYYSQSVNDGQFPPYWVGQLANRFGYPLFFFSYHLPWIVGVILLKLGLGFFDTIKILLFLAYLGSGIGMYFFINALLKNKLSALLSAILYMWAPYHFLITLVSASMGIAFVFTFLPLLFWGIHLISYNSKIGPSLLAISISALILSHLMHVVFLLPITLIFLIWEFTNTKTKIVFIKRLVLGLILGLMLSSFYLLPAFYYSRYTRVHQETGFYNLYKKSFINLNQLIYSRWGFGPIVNDAKKGEISFQLGIAQWISIIGLFYLIIFRKLSKFYSKMSIYLLVSFLICVFLMLDISNAVWSLLVKYISLDYPFRLILPASFIASLCAGVVIVNIDKRFKILVFFALILVTLYTNRNHINVNEYTNFPISTYLNLETEITTNTFHEYLPIKANPVLLGRPWNEIVSNNLLADQVIQTTNRLIFNVNSSKEGTASAGQFYFPGQRVYIDNVNTPYDIDQLGRITFNVPSGVYRVIIGFWDTPLIIASKVLTVLGLCIVTLLLLKKSTFNKS